MASTQLSLFESAAHQLPAGTLRPLSQLDRDDETVSAGSRNASTSEDSFVSSSPLPHQDHPYTLDAAWRAPHGSHELTLGLRHAMVLGLAQAEACNTPDDPPPIAVDRMRPALEAYLPLLSQLDARGRDAYRGAAWSLLTMMYESRCWARTWVEGGTVPQHLRIPPMTGAEVLLTPQLPSAAVLLEHSALPETLARWMHEQAAEHLQLARWQASGDLDFEALLLDDEDDDVHEDGDERDDEPPPMPPGPPPVRTGTHA